jgi:glycerophosphoryl diester phosphodiesterase
MLSSYPELIAHRGYPFRYPENTLLAIQAAVEAGARFVEFDVLISLDHVPVLFHDRNMTRMCGVSGAIHEFTLAQLKNLPVSDPGKFGNEFIHNNITTLDEVITYLKSVPDVVAFVELKRQGLDVHGVDVFLESVLPRLESIQTQAVIISYSIEALLTIRRQSDFSVAAVFDDWREKESTLITQLKPEYMFTDINQLPETGSLECPGCTLAVYECTDPEQAIMVHRRGVDMVETFQIKEMLDAFREYR